MKGVRGPNASAERALAASDPVLGRLIREIGPCPLAPALEGSLFEHLARAIVYQQLSGKAAATIHGRFLALFPDERPCAAALAGLDDAALRAAGLSRQKAGYMRALAEHLADADPLLTELQGVGDDELVADLTRIKGIGRWTVEMILIFRLGRPDVLPIHDLGIQRGIELAYGLAARPTPREVARHGERWQPWRSVASWYMWRASERK